MAVIMAPSGSGLPHPLPPAPQCQAHGWGVEGRQLGGAAPSPGVWGEVGENCWAQALPQASTSLPLGLALTPAWAGPQS